MAALQLIVEEFGGTVPQVMGDGFMAVFGVPLVHEDDAERAVRAAIALRDHVRCLNANQPEEPFPEVHAGVNSGEVMVAPADEQAGFRVVGDTVNVASRLADLATAAGQGPGGPPGHVRGAVRWSARPSLAWPRDGGVRRPEDRDVSSGGRAQERHAPETLPRVCRLR